MCGFDNIAGNLEAKKRVKDIAKYLLEPERFALYGARMPRGILFHGKPGTGKLLMAWAMACNSGRGCEKILPEDIISAYYTALA